MKVLSIVSDYLKKNGLDGLYNESAECACVLADFAPCGEMSAECIAGYRAPCDCGDHDFHIVEQKAEKT